MDFTRITLTLSAPLTTILEASMSGHFLRWNEAMINNPQVVSVSFTYMIEGTHLTTEEKLNAILPSIDLTALQKKGCKVLSIR